MFTSRQRGNPSPGVGYSVVGMMILCAAAAGLLPISRAHGQTATDRPTVKVVGPLAAKEMLEAIAAEYGTAKAPIVLDYCRIETPGGAAGAFVAGRDMMLCMGTVAEKDLGYSKDRWKTLAPSEHTIAAQAVAVVVHARSPVENITIEQLRALFSPETRDWSAFGAGRSAVRRYGLAHGDMASVMFHEKVLSAGKCGMITRKKDSDEVLAAVAGDPQSIAFVDAVAASAAGDTVKIVAIGTGKAAMAPNVQTIKDGAYPLSQTLTLYISPNATDAAREFADFILAGKGDAICRRHGFMPTLRAASADVLAAFEKLYGPDIRRVKATPDTADDLALAGQMIQSARSGKLDAELLAAMCEAAHDLAMGAPAGRTIALEALAVLSEKVPDKRFDCAVKRAALCERVYKESKSRADGEHLVEALMTAADLGTSARQFAEAADSWKKALAVAEEVNSPRLAAIKERQPAFEARRKALAEAASLAARLRGDPRDIEARMKLFWTQLIELDNPGEAVKYIDVVTAEDFRTYVPLASLPADKLSEEAALKLAEWYVGLVEKADVGGKELMNARARACYLRFFELHKERDDALAVRAALGIQKVGGKVPDAPKPPEAATGRRPSAPVITAGLKDGEEITDLKLAEFIAANPNLTRLGAREIGTARRITDLRPLERLTKLTTLELQQAGNIKDFSPLAKLPNLTNLTITGLEIEDSSGLSALARLNTLNISGAANVTDITPIGRLLGLKTLNLSGCAKVKDLTPISRLTGLTNLNLSGCEGVNDIGPLEKLSKTLVTLNLSGTSTGYIMPLARMPRLKTLDLRRCEKISADDLDWLAKRLAECKVLSDAPAKEPAAVSPGGW